jgi:hypothetical protein
MGQPMQKRVATVATLITFFASLYMLTYSGRIESGDSLILFDAVSSLVRFGDKLLDESAWFSPPTSWAYPNQEYPLKSSVGPPLQIFLATSLFRLANAQLGFVHTVWLFNVLINAATTGVFYLYALCLGYRAGPAVLGALLFGLGTIMWPYSKSFFREPLFTMLLLIAAYNLERWRSHSYRSLSVLLLALTAIVLAGFTKESLPVAVPGLLAIIVPDKVRNQWRQVGLLILLLLILFVALTAYVNWYVLARSMGIQPLADFIGGSRRFLQPATHAYLFSIGGSLWGTSPVLLFALPGAWMLHRKGQYRYIGVALMMIAAFALIHARFGGEHWFGGLSWPPRFMIPVVPFVMLATLPMLERLMHRPTPKWLQMVVVLIVLYSIWVQLSGVTLWWGEYAGALPPESGQLIEWSGGLNQVRFLRWVVIPSLWDDHALDFAWVRAGSPLWPLAFAGLVIGSGMVLWWLVRPLKSDRKSASGEAMVRRASVILPLLFCMFTALGLKAIYRDDLYLGANDALRDLLALLDAEVGDGEVVLVDSSLHQPSYERFFLNYNRSDRMRIITLPPQPGERFAADVAPLVVSENTEALLNNLTVPLIHLLAERRDRLWLVTDTGPYITWTVRPVERFMAAHYYPIREFEFDPRVRLIEYITVDAPDPFGFRGPEHLTDLVYGGVIQLGGYTLPSGTIYAPGESLPISFYWYARQPIDQNYTIAWFVADLDGGVVTQGWDSQPGGGFAPTRAWAVGVPVWDNRALILPTDLEPGRYQIWVKVYTIGSNSQIIDLPVVGNLHNGETIGVLNTNIEVYIP